MKATASSRVQDAAASWRLYRKTEKSHHLGTTMKNATETSAKGGRPPKFVGPSTRITLTLPNRTLARLAEIGSDRAKSIVKAVDAVLDADDAGPLPTPVRKLPFGPGESILCLADNRLLRSIPWLSLVEIGPGRHVIALDDEITVEKFEIALGDLLDEPPAGTREEEIVAVRALLDMVRTPRRRNVLRTKSLLVVPAR